MPVLMVVAVLIMIATFAVVMFVTRPTGREKRLQERLQNVAFEPHVTSAAEETADLLKQENYSDIPILDAVLRRLSLTTRLKNFIAQSDSEWTVGRLVAATLLIFVVVAWLSSFWVSMLAIRLVLAFALATVPFLTIYVKRQRRFRKFEVVLPEAMDLMTRSLRAGHAVSSAIEMIGQEISSPVGPEFRKCFEQQNFGLPFRESLEDLARRVPVPDLKFLVTAILVQKESGGNLAEVLDKAGAVIRERLRLKGELAIYTAQGRLTGWILGALPFIMFVLLSMVNSQYTGVLLHDPWGQNLVIVGIVLMAIGFYIIKKIVDVKV
jgi:tight adherence protein B